jgi:glycosyltransferase involved in cell wall biosynthesis
MTVRLIHGLEHLCCHLPDLLIIDTQDYANWFQDEYGVRPQRIRLIPIGADDRIFTPQYQAEAVSDRFLCVYYGSFIPNHGVKTIIEAARLLSDDSTIHFELIGHGPDRDPAFELVKTYDLNNVTFTNWMDETSLIKRLALADVCLGTFGNTPQALMTMQNKIHEGLALAKPLINGDSPVMRSTLQHKEHIFLCKREDPLSLAEAIRTLKSDAALRMKLSTQGFLFYRDHFSFELLGKQFVHVLTSLDG